MHPKMTRAKGLPHGVAVLPIDGGVPKHVHLGPGGAAYISFLGVRGRNWLEM